MAFSQTTTEKFSRPQDLTNARIAVVTGSNAQKWTQYYRARITPVKDLASAITLLDNKQVEGIIYARLFLKQ